MRGSILIAVLLVAGCGGTKATNGTNAVAAGNDVSSTSTGVNTALQQYPANATMSENQVVENMAMSGAENANAAGNAAGSAPVADAWCPVVRDRLPQADCDYFTEVRARLDRGVAGLDAPPRMQVGMPAQVSVAIARQPPASPQAPVAAPDVNALLDTPAEAVGETGIARRMAARLVGEGFTIAPEGAQQIDLAVSDQARWDWQATPAPEGAARRRLTAHIYAVVEFPDGRRHESLMKTLTLHVEVQVRPEDYATGTERWLRLLGAIAFALAFLIGGIFAVRTVIRNRGGPPPGPSGTG